ncbi:MAG: GNAT family N-acetyltransferase [Corynebacterium sp.]|nr:GNAT family N-acetyltransferase [Corynebacterium sp.]
MNFSHTEAARIRAIETAYAKAFPGLDHSWAGGWLLRAGDGITERSNSAAPLEPAAWEEPLPLAQILAFYGHHNLPPRILVPDYLGKNSKFAAGRWVAGPEILNLWRPLAGFVAPAAGEYFCRFSAQPDAQWLSMYHFRGEPLPAAALNLLRQSIDGQMVFASLCTPEGRTVAITRGTLTADHEGELWLGYSAVEVDPAFRRRGLGTLLGSHVLAWGATHGATRAYLQVLAANEAGLALYSKLDFEKSHGHRYLQLEQ